jgi:SAM-dependent methyltransferase
MSGAPPDTRDVPPALARCAEGAPAEEVRALVAFTQCLFTLSDHDYADCESELVAAFLGPARGLPEHDVRQRMFARLRAVVPNPAFVVPPQPGSAAWRGIRRAVFRRSYWREVARRSEARRRAITSAASTRMVRRGAAFFEALIKARSSAFEGPLNLGYHPAACEHVARALSGLRSPVVLDIGTGDGTLQRMLKERLPSARLAGTDLLAFPGGVIAAAELNPFRDATFDAVCALGVLELVADPAALVAEIARLLKPGGVCALVTNALAVKFLSRNPLSYVEGLVGGVLPAVLPAYHGVYEPLTPLPMAHHAFGRGELAALCGRHLTEVRVEPLHFAHLRKFGLARLAPRLPGLRWFCGEFLVTGRRPNA